MGVDEDDNTNIINIKKQCNNATDEYLKLTEDAFDDLLMCCPQFKLPFSDSESCASFTIDTLSSFNDDTSTILVTISYGNEEKEDDESSENKIVLKSRTDNSKKNIEICREYTIEEFDRYCGENY